jgi:hypothetical protein
MRGRGTKLVNAASLVQWDGSIPHMDSGKPMANPTTNLPWAGFLVRQRSSNRSATFIGCALPLERESTFGTPVRLDERQQWSRAGKVAPFSRVRGLAAKGFLPLTAASLQLSGERTRPRGRWLAPSPTTSVASHTPPFGEVMSRDSDRRGRRSAHARARVLPKSKRMIPVQMILPPGREGGSYPDKTGISCPRSCGFMGGEPVQAFP